MGINTKQKNKINEIKCTNFDAGTLSCLDCIFQHPCLRLCLLRAPVVIGLPGSGQGIVLVFLTLFSPRRAVALALVLGLESAPVCWAQRCRYILLSPDRHLLRECTPVLIGLLKCLHFRRASARRTPYLLD